MPIRRCLEYAGASATEVPSGKCLKLARMIRVDWLLQRLGCLNPAEHHAEGCMLALKAGACLRETENGRQATVDVAQ
jgi:hypothetical protein